MGTWRMIREWIGDRVARLHYHFPTLTVQKGEVVTLDQPKYRSVVVRGGTLVIKRPTTIKHVFLHQGEIRLPE